MKELLIPVFLCFCLIATPAHAFDLISVIAASLAQSATAYEGGDVADRIRAYATTRSATISSLDSLARIASAKLQKYFEPVEISIEKYKINKLYMALMENIKNKKTRIRLSKEQAEWEKNVGPSALARSMNNLIGIKDSYMYCLQQRYNELDKLRKRLGLPADIATKKAPIAFDDSTEEVCGDVIVNNPVIDDENIIVKNKGNVIIADMGGKIAALYSNSPFCRKVSKYVCGHIVGSEKTLPEIIDRGVNANKVFEIENCMGD